MSFFYSLFQIEAPDVGQLQKVRIGHDGAGMFSGWHMEKVNEQAFNVHVSII